MAYNPITIPMTVAADTEALSVSSAVAIAAGNADLGTKSITANGTYNASDDSLDGYSQVTVNVSGGSSTLITKNISANGTYNASSDSADGYSQVTVAVPASAVDSGTKNISTNGTHDVVGYANANVNVPNSYSAGDEGKVVSNGALVSQTSDTVTTNDTYDTTLINSLTVNVSGGGGTGVRTGTFTPASFSATESFSVGTTDTIKNLLIMPTSETPLKSSGKTLYGFISNADLLAKSMILTSNNSGSGLLAPSGSSSSTRFTQNGSTITVTSNAGSFERISYTWFAW